MIKRFSGIAYDAVYTNRRSELDSVRQIRSDGQVDDAFKGSSESFIPSITDPRVENFLKSGTAPDESWKAHELGGFDSPNQSLFVEDGKVALRSQIEEAGKTVRHRIDAPFDEVTGKVNLESSFEGFDIQSNGKTLTFEIPGGSNIELHEDFDNFFQ
ncbi:MAG: hypothetical protein KC800_22220 [Candidatus Eremiobacteraeota bacterium]|nr:hypothetical protein [Candidatus Eremiobacteraeota bacterium]